MNSEEFAPIVLFVYNRLDKTKQTVEALKRNVYAENSLLYIFSDGGKDLASWKKVWSLRAYLKTIRGFKDVIIIEREENYYLERNVIEGVTKIVNQYGRVIVLEDDICTAPGFLRFMNEALIAYQNEKQVMHISGFNHFDIESVNDIVFTQFMACWGWATWSDRWAYFKHFDNRGEALAELTLQDMLTIEYGGNFQCLKTLNSNPIPWDVCWYIAIYKLHKLCIAPAKTLVKNIGIYRGTHANVGRIFGKYIFDRPYFNGELRCLLLPAIKDESVEHQLEIHFSKEKIEYNLFGKIVRYFYLKFWKHS